MKYEHRSSPWRQFCHRLLYRFGHESAVAIVLGHRGVVFDVDFELRETPDLSQRVEGAVDGNSMSPCSELRVTPVAWKRPENLHPDFLRDVRSQLGITTKPAYDRVNVR